MLADADKLLFPVGVSLADGMLSDEVRGTSWPLNGSGAFVLDRLGRPIEEVVGDLARAFTLPPECARRDVLRFAWYLNTLALVNVERAGSPLRRAAVWCGLAARLMPAGTLPPPVACRRALDTTSLFRAFGTCLVAAARRSLVIAGLTTASVLQFEMFLGAPDLLVPLFVGCGTGVGVALHEAVHAASLRGVPSAFVTRGRRTYVLHAAVGASRRTLVAVAGPLAVSGLGVALVLVGVLVSMPFLAVGGCPLCAHALCLTVAGGDGRAACGLS